ncbi:MAG: PaaI family thioesterase [Gammaproteobacteria bacterium]|jgi:uncharacterized protein (TIGR00369 family)
MSADRVENIVEGEGFSALLGIQLVEREPDRVVARLPYKESLGVGRINGGAISALVDIASTAAFWSHPDLPATARGATVGFTINFLRLAVQTDLVATATVRRRGGTLCTGEVTVVNDAGDEVAVATVTYKLDGGRTS